MLQTHTYLPTASAPPSSPRGPWSSGGSSMLPAGAAAGGTTAVDAAAAVAAAAVSVAESVILSGSGDARASRLWSMDWVRRREAAESTCGRCEGVEKGFSWRQATDMYRVLSAFAAFFPSMKKKKVHTRIDLLCACMQDVKP